ncbi:hypothetical protein ACFSKL_10960 [Belliella marina]|uniref:C1q domain-containing protein n=1 Tax=Belliella marina TaxID=1644146 RepID=A0ABW4VP64_9BACT
MKNVLSSIVILLVCNIASAQVGINTTEPKATLDVTAKMTDGSSAEGVLLPRLTGDQIQSADAVYGTEQIGTLIYATEAVTVASTKTANITAAGYYFFDGIIWQKVGNDAFNYTAGNGLTLNGTETELGGTLNKGTIVAQGDFPLAFTSSAINGFSVDGTTLSVDAANNRVGIGTTTPTAQLDINGQVKITDGTEEAGKVLTSDAVGAASWQNPLAGSMIEGTIGNLVNVSSSAATHTYSGGSITFPRAGTYMVYARWRMLSPSTSHPSGTHAFVNTALSTSTSSNTQAGMAAQWVFVTNGSQNTIPGFRVTVTSGQTLYFWFHTGFFTGDLDFRETYAVGPF